MILPKDARGALLVALGCFAAACEDPARPAPEFADGGSVFVDSDPQGARILVDFVETGEVTPAQLVGVEEGARNITIELDTANVTYAYNDVLLVASLEENQVVAGPLTARCATPQCLRDAAAFHSAADLRFIVNAAGPLFLFDGDDIGITWPSATSNSYAAVGMATMTALVGDDAVSIGLRNAGGTGNFWAGRPIPNILSTDPYTVRVPAWITPPFATNGARLRGLEVVQEVTADEALPGALLIRVTWRNISADSLYRLLDPGTPVSGVTYTDAWLGFILDADVGAFTEERDDLVSYSAERNLVFAYDAEMLVTGFSGGWSDHPGLVGLMVLDGPGDARRLNAWTDVHDFAAGVDDEDGRALIAATQSFPPNHLDARIGYAPDDEDEDYFLSAAAGPFDLAPGDSVSATFAVLLAPPAPGTFTSGQLLPAGDPADATRPLAATAEPLLQLADRVLGVRPD